MKPFQYGWMLFRVSEIIVIYLLFVFEIFLVKSESGHCGF